MKKEITLTVTCNGCGFQVRRIFFTNEHGYFEIPQAYCPNCFNMLVWTATGLPTDYDKDNEDS